MTIVTVDTDHHFDHDDDDDDDDDIMTIRYSECTENAKGEDDQDSSCTSAQLKVETHAHHQYYHHQS